MTRGRRTVVPVVLDASAGSSGPVTVERWLAAEGDEVVAGAPVAVVRIAGTRVYVAAPAAGTLTAIVAGEGATVDADARLAEVGTGVSASATNALLERIDAADDPHAATIMTMLELVERRDAALAGAIRACAVPRRFDATVVAVLTEAGDEAAAGLYDQLLGMQFVHVRRDGMACYDETTRATLLEQWRAPLERSRFDELNNRMRTHYDRERAIAGMLEEDLRRVADTVREANPLRYSELESIVQGGVRGPLMEILYHAAAISGEELFTTFEGLAHSYEGKGQLLLCQTLVHTAIKHLTMLQPDSDRFAWLSYWNGRLARGLGDVSEAEAVLSALLDGRSDDVGLRQWAFSELGALRYQQDRMAEAAECYQSAIDLAEQSGADSWNLGAWYAHLADVELTIGELDKAVGHYGQAIEASQAGPQPNVFAQAGAGYGLSQALHRLGRPAEALAAALRSLNLLRLEQRTDRAQQLRALTAIAELSAADEPRLSVTAFAEVQRLTDDLHDEPRASDWPVRFVNAFVDSGRLHEAGRVLDDLDDGPAWRMRGLRTALLNLRATLHFALGHYDRVIAAVTALLPEPTADLDWEALTALSYRGMAYKATGALANAGRDLTTALQNWERIGNVVAVEHIRLQIADLERRRGDLHAAAALTEQAGHHLRKAGPKAAAEYHLMRASVLLDQGRTREAATDAERAVELAARVGAVAVGLEAEVQLARCESARGEWAAVTRAAQRAAGLAERLEANGRWRPSADQARADQANADGARILTEPTGGPEELERARGLFRAAVSRLPDHAWYQLNAAWAHAAMGDWADAVRATERAIGVRGGMPELFLREELATYRLRLIEDSIPTRELLAVVHAARADAADASLWRLGIAVDLREGDLLAQFEASTAPAEAAYRRGLARAEGRAPARDIARFHARLAVLAAVEARLPAVVDHLTRALAQLPPETSADLAADCLVVPTFARYHPMVLAALALIDEGPGEPAVRRSAAGVRMALVAMLRPAPPGDDKGAAEAGNVVIEADARLFPENENTAGVQWMLETGIPETRKRFAARTGLTLPGVTVRAVHRDRAGSYEISHAGDVLARGDVPLGGVFVPTVVAGDPPVRDPISGQLGRWLPDQPHPPDADGADPYGFLLRHLEAAVHADPARLLTVEQTRRLADEHSRQYAGSMPLFESGRPQRVQLLQSVCYGLLSDGGSIHQFGAIADAVTAAEGTVTASHVIARLRSSPHLDPPDQAGTGHLLQLDPAVEQLLSDAVRGTGLLTPQVSRLVRSTVTRSMTLVPAARALVVDEAALRPLVRGLVARDFPLLQVVAAGDLLDRPEHATVERVG
jgi:tetratricopeptide (TPR) repeat protein